MNEARAVNAISHPNIIEVFDTGFLADSGAPYLLMEYLVGESLGARLGRVGRLPVPEALAIAGQTAEALAAAHEQGIIHRDLKPENLFLVPRTSGGDLVKVLDFGIAKLRPDLAELAPSTQPGELVGTPQYMSPEQCQGNLALDQRTDVYALGIIAYEMLCGRPPFLAAGLGELLTHHLTREPEPLRTHLAHVPPVLEEAVLRALRKDPEQRFASMREFRAALGPVLLPRLTPRRAESTSPNVLPTSTLPIIPSSSPPSSSSSPPLPLPTPMGPVPASSVPVAAASRPARRRRGPVLAFVVAGLVGAVAWAYQTGRLSPGMNPGPALERGPAPLAVPRKAPAPAAGLAPPEPPPAPSEPARASSAAPAPSSRPRRKPKSRAPAPTPPPAPAPAEKKYIPPVW
jgi:serine/threonine-protein kinase